MLYFAYGSNMNWRQMWERCPSAWFKNRALLVGHRLAVTRKSNKRNCGAVDVVPESGRGVWGAVFAIQDSDVQNQDRSEGYEPGRHKNSYVRRRCTVLADGDAARHLGLRVFSYFGVVQPNPPLPNSECMRLIASEARHWDLPDDYVRELEGPLWGPRD